MAITYRRPKLPADANVHTVVPENQDGDLLGPDTKVTVINRGKHALLVKWDGRDHSFQPGYNEVSYGVAVHAQLHLIVPGSRNVETGGFESYIGILGVDPVDLCEPFTTAEVVEQDAKVEAIDRTGQEHEFTVQRTSVARSRMVGQAAGGRRKPKMDGSEQISDAAREAAQYAMTPPEGGDAALASQGSGGGGDDE